MSELSREETIQRLAEAIAAERGSKLAMMVPITRDLIMRAATVAFDFLLPIAQTRAGKDLERQLAEYDLDALLNNRLMAVALLAREKRVRDQIVADLTAHHDLAAEQLIEEVLPHLREAIEIAARVPEREPDRAVASS